jgi:mannitol-specific phosphotransferase system IIBC component
MNKIFVSLSSISMDLERVAMGYQRGSITMGNRFLEEALMRKNEIDENQVKPSIKNLMDALDEIMKEKDIKKRAEDALMYSTLFQNASMTIS